MSKIILKQVGRSKVNKEITVAEGFSEEELGEMALTEVNKHLLSSEVWLEPDNEKGKGFWGVFVGYGRFVGNVEIVV